MKTLFILNDAPYGSERSYNGVLVKWLADQSSTGKGSRDRSPLEILRERYARGEINREEYEQKRRDLEPPA
jgi:uncharacterized membrane protein